MIDEIDIATRHALYWARGEALGENGEVLADGSYIYQPTYFSQTFFSLFDKLAQLNDYCFHQLLAGEQRNAELLSQQAEALASADADAAELDYLDDEIRNWDDNLSVIARATALVLLCSFVEWALKQVTNDLYGDVYRKPQKGLSKIEFLLQDLTQRGLEFNLDSEWLATLADFRSIRNAFAHGDWRRVEESLEGISLGACFSVVSRVFERLEEAAWAGPWLQDRQLRSS
ncbi:hypothetical protein [Pseudomonas mosselii]|uniref:Uncharacterized protein n=1 Tax=Pseudomonas mosselii TaxID=78327 RepID=A0AA42RTM0_9PSED|nr:hypothetical protein [Pseudomonas mosselii]MDH1629677.1 hypothetical protein [Pseudomonas mosselii]